MAYNESYKRWNVPKKNHYDINGKLKRGETHQGYYKCQHPEKYIGNPQLIIYRSGYELTFCRWCDFSPSILRWSSEPMKVPYANKVSKLAECQKYNLNPNDPKNWEIKNYNLDFWCEIKKDENTVEKWFVEIKPSSELKKPIPPDKNAPLKVQRKFVNEAKRYLINEEKFKSLNAWAEKSGGKFYVFTEIQLSKMCARFWAPNY